MAYFIWVYVHVLLSPYVIYVKKREYVWNLWQLWFIHIFFDVIFRLPDVGGFKIISRDLVISNSATNIYPTIWFRSRYLDFDAKTSLS